MRPAHLIVLLIATILCATAQLPGQSSVPEELGRIEKLKKVYKDPANNPLARARALEQMIGIYEQLVKSESKKPRTMRHILDGEIEWQLISAKLLVSERARQGRFAVEELGLAGDWAKDLSETLARLEVLLKPASDRLAQLGQYMRADDQFERNYVVTGLDLRLTRAKIEVDYYRAWVCYYRALLGNQASEQKQLLESAVEYLRRCIATDRANTNADTGDRSAFGQKAVFLMSKVLRRLNHLSQADKMLSYLETQKLSEQSAYQVGLERCRLLATQSHYDMALAGLGQVGEWCAGKKAFDQLPVRLTLAYLQCSIQAAKAAKLAEAGDIPAARQISRQRLEGLAKIFRLQTSSQVRGIIYEQVRKTRLADVPDESMADLELLAMGVGLAGQGQTQAALKFFDELLSRTDSAQLPLHAEALAQAGQAAQEQRPLLACNYLDRLVKKFPDSPQAQPGLILAVQISAKLCQDRPRDQAVEELCFKALERLMSRYPTSEQAKQWRFYWASLLSKRGELAKADEQFEQISKQHPSYVQARYYQLDLRRQLINRQASPGKNLAYTSLAQDFFALASYVRTSTAPAKHDDKTVQGFGARARLEAVRIFCVELNEPQTALRYLDSFAADFAGQPQLLSQAQRYRVVALSELGRLDQAGRLTIQMLRDDPAQTLEIADAMLRRMDQKFEDSTSDDISADDKQLAHCWMQLAQARLDLAQKSDSPDQQKAQSVLTAKEMLARAMLAAGELDEALNIFEGLHRSQSQSARYVRMMGKILLAQKRYDAAAQQWAQLIRGLERNSPAWFEAWYQALRTNYQAGAEPKKITQRIKQLQALDAQMGSEEMLAKFEKLLSELQTASVRAN